MRAHWIAAVGLLALACGNDKDGDADDTDTGAADTSDTSDTDPTDTDPAADPTALRVLVVDLDGEPIAGAKVTVGTRVLGTDDDGVATLIDANLTGSVGVEAVAAGFAPSFVNVAVQPGSNATRITLPDVVVDTLGSAATGGQVSSSGLSMVFPAGAVVDGSGNPVSGPVEVAIGAVSGDDLAAAPPLEAGSDLLAAVVAFDVRLRAGGVDVHVDDDVDFTFDVGTGSPVFSMTDPALYSYDPSAKTWVEEGDLTLNASAGTASGTLPHFSWYALADRADPSVRTCLQARVNKGGAPLGGFEVTSTSQQLVVRGTTDAQGALCIPVSTASPGSAILSGFGSSADGAETYIVSRIVNVTSGTIGATCGGSGCVDAGVLEVSVRPRDPDTGTSDPPEDTAPPFEDTDDTGDTEDTDDPVDTGDPVDTDDLDTGDTSDTGDTADTDGVDTGDTADTSDSGDPIDTGVIIDTSVPPDTDTDTDTGAIDTGPIDTGTIDTFIIDTGGIDTGGSGLMFECGDGTTVSFGQVCDFFPDCPNGADEFNCGFDTGGIDTGVMFP